MRWLLLPPPSLLPAPSSSSSSSSGESWESKRGVLLAASASVLCASAAFAIYQLTKILFSVVRDSEYEADKLITAVAATIHSDSPDVQVPEELVVYDDIEDIYTYGSLQELFYRRSVGGETDWEWSFDTDEWYSTADLAPDHSFILDPPSIIFIARLHLTSVARRKYAVAAGRGIANGGSSSSSSHKQPSRIPPPVELPEWAQQQQVEHLAAVGHSSSGGSSKGASKDSSSSRGRRSAEQQTRGSHDSSGSSSSAAGGSRGGAASWSAAAAAGGAAAGGASTERRLEDAPDLLCCPITGQIMLQPVTLPSGKTFEYEAVRRWVSQHGSDPTTCEPVSILDLHPNLLLREMVEKWLAGQDPLADHAPEP